MSRANYLAQIQQMHASGVVSRDAVIAWYRFYESSLPKMQPERSVVDLIRTVNLWMQLTDQGGPQPFPFEYRSSLVFAALSDPGTFSRKPNPAVPLGQLAVLSGLVGLFFSRRIGVGLMILGAAVLFIGYKLDGGSANLDLMAAGSTLYEQEGKRVIEWAKANQI